MWWFRETEAAILGGDIQRWTMQMRLMVEWEKDDGLNSGKSYSVGFIVSNAESHSMLLCTCCDRTFGDNMEALHIQLPGL